MRRSRARVVLPAEALARLLELPARGDLLDRWGKTLRGYEPPLVQLEAMLLEHTRVDPATSRRVVEHTRRAVGATLRGSDRARLLRLEAHVARLVGEAERAGALYARAVTAFLRAGERRDAGLTAIGWVDALSLAGSRVEALRVGDRAKRLLGTSDPSARARLETNLGNVLYWMGRYSPAAARYRAALATFRRRGDLWSEGLALFNLGNVLARSGKAVEARRSYERAAAIFRRKGSRVPEMYALHALAALDVAEGKWESGSHALRALRAEFATRGDERALAALSREEAELLVALGAFEAASAPASAALAGYRKLGLHHEAAHAAFLTARVFAARGATHDAAVRLHEVSRHWTAAGNRWALAMTAVQESRVLVQRGRPEDALEVLGPSARILDRRDPRGAGAASRAATAAAHLAAGNAGVALRAARQAWRRAERYPARLERPRTAITLARSLAALGRSADASRWAERGVAELEAMLMKFGDRATRTLVAGAREPLYREAVEIMLEHGGRRRVERALDLLARARSPRLVEDLLQGREDPLDASLRRGLARLREDLLSGGEPGEGDVRYRSLRREAERLAADLAPWPRRAPGVLRRALARRRLSQWRTRLGERRLVFYDRGRDGWRAFVAERRGPVRLVALPDGEGAIRDAWLPMRILLETAAAVPASRRAAFLDRTREECADVLDRLRRAFWDPLSLGEREIVLVPTGDLLGIPLEALARSVVTRVPHPALLAESRTAGSRDALLLSGNEAGAGREVKRVRSLLEQAGYRAVHGRRRRDLGTRGKPLGVLHVAAHGVFHREAWLLSGMRLADGWVGFESLPARRVAGSLLYFSACESGLSRELPGAELDGWMAAGLGAGAREMVLALWKVDDAGATAFAERFYARWTAGESAARAASGARLDLSARGAHPFSWAPFIAVG